MKKNSFLQGAFIATIGIVLSKILGIIYVIPFYSIVGSQGGALYGYAYSIYTIFLGISQAGIPIAISKMISEYNALHYYEAKERTFKIGKKLLTILGILSFLIMFLFARVLAYIIIGDISGGNSIEDVTFVIRIISTALLFVPLMSVYRGYLEGHSYMTPSSISKVLEQIIRVLVIVIGSYLTLRVFNLSLRNTIAISVFAATIGAITSYLYLFISIKKNKKVLQNNKDNKVLKITDNEIIKKVLIYAIPFVLIDIFRSLINSVDVFMLVKILVNHLGYSITTAEEVMSVISTWGQKINMIVIAICSGIIISLVPNLTSSFTKKDFKSVNKIINEAITYAFLFCIPMTIGISFLAKPIWTVFYGVNDLSTSVYQYYVFTSLGNVLFTVGVVTLQLLQEHKKVFLYLLTGLLTNALFNIPLLYLFNYLGLPAYYGSTTSTILGYSICGLLSLRYIKKKYKVTYNETIIKIIKFIIISLIMVTTLYILNRFIPFTSNNRVINILYIIGYSIIGTIIYFTISVKIKLVDQKYINLFLNKIKRIIK